MRVSRRATPKSLSIVVTNYKIRDTALLVVKNVEKGKNEEKVEKREEVVMAMCCPEGKGAEGIKEKVLLKLGEGLEGRGNVVMTRLSDKDLHQIDALVEVEVFKSRSEAAAFFIKEGVQARNDLFQKVMPTVDKIRELKEQAKKSLSQGTTG